ncbi:hypothetical protein [Marixanthomonas spongiae]|uniref:Polysaccharide chain length determinant N-terminal domain-containing protein n=1 Tax=Marixanthomonas spongiae TaxID=2174845 RepID=A0A2U0I455_9FLAO|nr:hypothetical protein [Marixanthomonas spongiae]PVW15770.1 hypothetical protein DDV96_05740 [Marixanthomonas spongiae]
MEKETKAEHSIFDLDTFELLKVLNKSKKTLLAFIAVFFTLGVIVILLSITQYTSNSIFLAQFSTEKKVGKRISKIATMMGVNVGGDESNNILPMHYPLIVESTPFKKELLKTKIPVKGRDSSVSVAYYVNHLRKTSALSTVKSYTLGLPSKIVGLFDREEKTPFISETDTNYHFLTAKEKGALGYLYSKFSVNVNDVDGYIEISTTFPEAKAAAKLTSNIQNLLQDFIIEYNIKKARQELEYINERFKEAENDYFNKRTALSNFKDRNINVVSNVALNRLEQLQTEYSLSSNIYSQLAGELETAKLNVKKDTPVFTIIKPATVPLEPASPQKLLLLLQFVSVGLLVGVFYIFFNHFYPEIKKKMMN